MNELVVVEGILGTSSVDANMFEASTSQPKSNGKGKKKKKKDFIKQDGKPIALGVANKGKKKDYVKGKCFHYGKKDHWKTNCPKFRVANDKCMKSSFFLEICLVQNPMDSLFSYFGWWEQNSSCSCWSV